MLFPNDHFHSKKSSHHTHNIALSGEGAENRCSLRIFVKDCRERTTGKGMKIVNNPMSPLPNAKFSLRKIHMVHASVCKKSHDFLAYSFNRHHLYHGQ